MAAGNELVLMKKGRTKSEKDDCPICQLPLPLDAGKQSYFQKCCMKQVCNGCALAARKCGMGSVNCPFCRAPPPNESQSNAILQARVDAGDPAAIYFLGTQHGCGLGGFVRDASKAAELYERAAELGENNAHFNLANLYAKGTEVEKDAAKATRHLEVAAMGGHVFARRRLGYEEGMAGNYDISLQHFLIAAKLGCDDSLGMVKATFISGLATKADYAAALRGYQNAVEEMSSHDREEAKALGIEKIMRGQIWN